MLRYNSVAVVYISSTILVYEGTAKENRVS